MESATAAVQPGTAAASSEDDHKGDQRWEAARAASGGERGREMLEHAAQGAELDAGEEYSALDWLLGDAQPIVHEIPVDIETEKGMRTLKFIVVRIDPKKIDAIELRHFQQSTGRVDRITADSEIITEACDEVEDHTGRKIKLTSEEWRTIKTLNPATGEREPMVVASSALALERRFRGQQGLLTLVAAEIRRLAGYDNQRLGTSQRRLVEASLG